MLLQDRVSSNVSALIEARGLDPAELAMGLALTTAEVNERIGGRLAWRTDEVDMAAAWLGVDIDALVHPPGARSHPEATSGATAPRRREGRLARRVLRPRTRFWLSTHS